VARTSIVGTSTVVTLTGPFSPSAQSTASLKLAMILPPALGFRGLHFERSSLILTIQRVDAYRATASSTNIGFPMRLDAFRISRPRESALWANQSVVDMGLAQGAAR
jgi:hypothetical protein